MREAERTTCSQCGKQFPASVRICPDDGTVLEHESPSRSQVGQVLDGKYRLDAFLAEGGMGAVYRATHVMLEKVVAIKLIHPGVVASMETVKRFQREARAATALNHRNIVAVYDLGQTADGTLYIAMEYIDGPSLKAVIQKGHGVSPERTIAILRQVASALSIAHRHNIIHRDLKPHNIMLARAEGFDVVKLVDFGIAKTFDDATQLTMTGTAMGTPQYMAPEQAEGRVVDARSDLYSLGVIVYEMLAGEVPFSDPSVPALLVKHIRELPAPPSTKKPGVPPALEAIAMTCLEKDPARRFQTADAFAAALENAAVAFPDVATLPMGAPAAGASAPDRTPRTAQLANTMPMAGPDVRELETVRMPAEATVPVPRPPAFAQPAPPVRSATVPTVVPPAPSVDKAATAAAATAAHRTAPTLVPAATGPTLISPQAPPVVPPDVSTVPPPQRRPMGAYVAGVALLVLVAVGIAGYMWSRRTSDTSAAQASAQADAPRTVPAAASQPPPVAPSPQAAPANQPPAASVAAPPTAATASAAKPASPLPAVTQAQEPPKTAPPPASPAATQAPPAMIPENAAVFFGCSGAQEVCGALRTAVDEALDKGGFRSVRSAERADITVGAAATPVQERVSQQFGTPMATRTYSIEVSGEARHTDDAIRMPAASTVSFDPTFGRERLDEKARVVASDVVDRLRAYVKKTRGQ